MLPMNIDLIASCFGSSLKQVEENNNGHDYLKINYVPAKGHL